MGFVDYYTFSDSRGNVSVFNAGDKDLGVAIRRAEMKDNANKVGADADPKHVNIKPVNPDGLEVGPAENSKNTAANESQQASPEQEQISAAKASAAKPGGNSSNRKSIGSPRTPAGKEITKHNARRHGIFTEVIVLPGESRYEYESLLKGLWEARKPVKRLEELLVEKLAMIEWRRRRVLQAEGAEIRQGSEFLEWDQRNQHRHESEIVKRTLVREFKRFSDVAGLITEIQNPKVLEYCVELLLGLQERIKSRGLDFDSGRYNSSVNLRLPRERVRDFPQTVSRLVQYFPGVGGGTAAQRVRDTGTMQREGVV
jgi:hypothetical protein